MALILIGALLLQEDEEEDDEEAAEQEAQAREKRKKVLKPPGYKRPPPAKKKQPAKTEGGAEAEEGAEAVPKKARRTSVEVAAAMLPAERTVKVRDSTRQKVQVAEEERMIQEAVSAALRTKADNSQQTLVENLMERSQIDHNLLFFFQSGCR